MGIFFSASASNVPKNALIPVMEVSSGLYAPLACRINGKIIEPPERYFGSFVTEYRSIFRTYTPVIHNESGTVASYNGMGILYSPEYGDYIVSTTDTSTTKSIKGSGYNGYDSRLKRNGIQIPVTHSSSNISYIGGFKITDIVPSHGIGGWWSFINVRYKAIIMTDGEVKPMGCLAIVGGAMGDTCPPLTNSTGIYTESNGIAGNSVFLYSDLADFNDPYSFTNIRKIAVKEGAGSYGDLIWWLAFVHLRGGLYVSNASSVSINTMWISNPLFRLHRTNTSKKFLATIQSQSTCIYNECFF